MSDSFFDKFIADLVKGAENTEGFMRGGRVTVEVQREPRGREEKLAMDASTMLGGIPGLGPVLGGLSSAAREDNMGTGALTTAGSALGQYGGAHGGAALGGLTDSDRMRLIGALLGQAGGGMLGAAGGRALGEQMSGEPTRGQPMRGKRANLTPGGASLLGSLAGIPLGHLVGGPAGSAIGALAGPIAAGMTSDSGHGVGGAAGSALGQLGGGLAGLAGGGLAGGGLGALLGALGGKPGLGARIGVIGGAGLGGLYGSLRGEYEGANYGGLSDSPLAQVRRKLSADKEAGIGDSLARTLGGASGVAMRNPQYVVPAIGAGLGALGGLAGSEEDHRLEGALKGGLVGGGLGLALPAGANALVKAHPEAFMGGMMPKTALMNPRAAAASVMPGSGPIRSLSNKSSKTPPPIPGKGTSSGTGFGAPAGPSPFEAAPKRAMLEETYLNGAMAAAETFSVKEAIGPLLGLGLRAAGGLAKKVMGSGIGREVASAGVQRAMAPRPQQQPQQQGMS